MRLLLDTHILLWAISNPGRLAQDAAVLLSDRSNQIHFSAASIWKIAIKQSRGRRDFDFRADDIALAALATGFMELAIGWRVAAPVATLPWHHADPFDRLLVAQAMADNLVLLTADQRVGLYSDTIRLI
jgi:PIN domain nuclease of toxin-antitoxin system